MEEGNTQRRPQVAAPPGGLPGARGVGQEDGSLQRGRGATSNRRKDLTHPLGGRGHRRAVQEGVGERLKHTVAGGVSAAGLSRREHPDVAQQSPNMQRAMHDAVDSAVLLTGEVSSTQALPCCASRHPEARLLIRNRRWRRSIHLIRACRHSGGLLW